MKLTFANEAFFTPEESSLLKTISAISLQDTIYCLGLINMKHGFIIVSEYGPLTNLSVKQIKHTITFFTENAAINTMLCSLLTPYITALRGNELVRRSSQDGYEIMTASEIYTLLQQTFNQPMTITALGKVLKSCGFVQQVIKDATTTKRVYPVLRQKKTKEGNIPTILTKAGFKTLTKLLTIEV